MSSQKFAAFDIDGTIARTALYHQLVEDLVDAGLLPPEVRTKYSDKKRIWERREHPDAFNQYVSAMVQAYEPYMPGISIEDFEQTAKTLAERVKDSTYVFTTDLAKRLKEEGYFLIAISGSQKEVVEPFISYYGFDDFVAYEFERVDGRFTGKTNVSYKNKDVILKQLVEKHSLSYDGSYAVGDSFGDVGLLSLAENPIAFNPEQKLMHHAQENNWKIVVERKNVIYELEQSGGKYLLAETEG